MCYSVIVPFSVCRSRARVPHRCREKPRQQNLSSLQCEYSPDTFVSHPFRRLISSKHAVLDPLSSGRTHRQPTHACMTTHARSNTHTRAHWHVDKLCVCPPLPPTTHTDTTPITIKSRAPRTIESTVKVPSPTAWITRVRFCSVGGFDTYRTDFRLQSATLSRTRIKRAKNAYVEKNRI